MRDAGAGGWVLAAEDAGGAGSRAVVMEHMLCLVRGMFTGCCFHALTELQRNCPHCEYP